MTSVCVNMYSLSVPSPGTNDELPTLILNDAVAIDDLTLTAEGGQGRDDGLEHPVPAWWLEVSLKDWKKSMPYRARGVDAAVANAAMVQADQVLGELQPVAQRVEWAGLGLLGQLGAGLAELAQAPQRHLMAQRGDVDDADVGGRALQLVDGLRETRPSPVSTARRMAATMRGQTCRNWLTAEAGSLYPSSGPSALGTDWRCRSMAEPCPSGCAGCPSAITGAAAAGCGRTHRVMVAASAETSTGLET